MTVLVMRNKLNELIDKDSGNLEMFYNDGASGLVEILDIKEDFNTYDGVHVQVI